LVSLWEELVSPAAASAQCTAATAKLTLEKGSWTKQERKNL